MAIIVGVLQRNLEWNRMRFNLKATIDAGLAAIGMFLPWQFVSASRKKVSFHLRSVFTISLIYLKRRGPFLISVLTANTIRQKKKAKAIFMVGSSWWPYEEI